MRQAVSIIIPTYNRADMIGRALESVLPQVCPGDEIIVVDDGSKDNTAAAVEPYAERAKRSGSSVRYVWQKNAGVAAARNKGIAEAKHDLIAFNDSDDEWLPGKLDPQCRLMAARPDIVLCFSDFKLRFVDGRLVEGGIRRWTGDSRPWEDRLGEPKLLSQMAEWPEGKDDVRVYTGDLYRCLLDQCYVAAQTAMVRRSLVKELRFTEGIKIFEEWACFARVAQCGPVAYLDCDLAIQNGHTGDRVTDADTYARAVSRVFILEEVWGPDAEFQKIHGEAYRRLLDENRVVVAAGLISEGRTAEARAQLAQVHDVPMIHRFLSALPGGLARGVLAVRRKVLSLRH